MGHSIGDGVIVIGLAVAFVGYFYLKHLGRQRRMELIHAERLAAMDKGIPLPELPIDPPPENGGRPVEPATMLFPGIVVTALGAGTMVAFAYTQWTRPIWLLPLPLAFIGVGMLLYSFLPTDRER
jgi:hypothetical protein